jgi:hypothetical protein
MLGVKETEFRAGLTRIRGRIAIYASLGRYPKQEEEEYESEHGFSIEALPRGVIIGTVELYDCDGGDCISVNRNDWPSRLSRRSIRSRSGFIRLDVSDER